MDLQVKIYENHVEYSNEVVPFASEGGHILQVLCP